MALYAEKRRDDSDKAHQGRYYEAAVIKATASKVPGFLDVKLPAWFRERQPRVRKERFAKLNPEAGPARFLKEGSEGFEELKGILAEHAK